MANSKSAEKRIRQNEKRRLRNRISKSKVKTSMKKFLADVDSADKNSADESFKTLVKLMDTAARKGVYHQKSVARKKSRLHRILNAMKVA